MLRFLLVRKLFKSRNRCRASKRERTPSSLHECLDPPPPRRGLWRNWFIILFLVPALYYMIFAGRESRYEEYSVPVHREKVELRPKIDNGPKRGVDHMSNRLGSIGENMGAQASAEQSQKSESVKFDAISSKTPYYQIQKSERRNLEIQDLHSHPESSKKLYSVDAQNGTLFANQDGNNTILARVSVPNRHKKIVATTAGSRKYLVVCVAKHPKNRKGITDVEPRNVTAHMSYRQLLYKGGLYTPGNCKPRHKVAIIVAYRDRPINLAVFLFNIHPFLIDQAIEYRIFVIEQSGHELFNKGRLFNAGFVEAMKFGDWGCLIFHDVDLLPTNTKILYTCPTWPRHMSATIMGKQNDPNYRSLFGGVTSMTINQFKGVNGYSNLYWGWGGEDTDMFWRIKTSGLPIVRYSKSIAKFLALPHAKAPENPIRKQLSNNAMERYKKDGLSNLVYRLISTTMYQTYTHLLIDVNPEHENITELQIRWSK